KVLCIGDFHQVPAELEDCDSLVDFILQVAQEQKPDRILFTGDIYHYHNIIRSESLYFWKKAFDKLSEFKIISLVGNHDLNSESGPPEMHALLAHESEIAVIDIPIDIGGVLFMPYRHDKEQFINECNASKSNTIICHQSFNGAKFDNGFYDPSGIDLDFIHQKKIIAGHIHLPQAFSKVQYIGAPRWRTLSDANEDRNIWLFEFDSAGNVVKSTPFHTGGTCRRIWHFIDTESEPIDLNSILINSKDDFRFDIKGPANYIEQRTKEIKSAVPISKIRQIKVDNASIKIRESDGIRTAFTKYRQSYKPKYGTPSDKLCNLSDTRLGFNNAA
ncbi:MAG TPA: metallophosphoesterase, partial [Legionellaceae bacterium]|nr:metallophosphoesterase [Legionellaceae bacterium]